MKFECPCGEIILDQTDYLSNKADLISDQDAEDLLIQLERTSADVWSVFSHYSKTIYQCEKCGRVFIPKDGTYRIFVPEQPDGSIGVLRSIKGEKWKRNLRGQWTENKGELWWGFGVQDQGFERDFKSFADLQKRYEEVFQRLQTGDLLRDAMLKKDFQVVHQWPAPKDV